MPRKLWKPNSDRGRIIKEKGSIIKVEGSIRKNVEGGYTISRSGYKRSRRAYKRSRREEISIFPQKKETYCRISFLPCKPVY